MNQIESDFEKDVSNLRVSKDFLQILEFSGTVFGGYTALFTGSTDLQEAALITASANGADSLLGYDKKMEAVFAARRRMRCAMNAALNVEIISAKPETITSENTGGGQDTNPQPGITPADESRVIISNVSSTPTLSGEKQQWRNTLISVWGDIRTRFNNDWDGHFTDNSAAITKFEEAIKAAQTPVVPPTGVTAAESTLIVLTEEGYKDSIVKLLKCPLVQ